MRIDFCRFSAAVGKPGQAREARAAVRSAISTINPVKSIVMPSQRRITPFVDHQCIADANWLLTQEALFLYSSPYQIVTFNYACFSDAFSSVNKESALELKPLVFESDLEVEEEKTFAKQSASGNIHEGYLLLIPDPGLLDNFKNVKKRYCILKHEIDGNVVLEIQKQGIKTCSPFIIERVVLGTKKGRDVLEVLVFGHGIERRSILLTADVDGDLRLWFMEINKALIMSRPGNSKISIPNSSTISPTDSGSLDSDGNLSGDNASLSSAMKLLLSEPFENKSSLFMQYIPDTTNANGSKIVFRFTVEFVKLNLKVRVSNTENKQIEPFFIRFFIFDARAGRRLSEEFHINPNSDEINALIKGHTKNNGSSVEKRDLKHDINYGIFQQQLADTNINKVVFSVEEPHVDIYLIICIERILSSDSYGEAYMKTVGEFKSTLKLQKMLVQACNKLSEYRMPFAWTARSIYQDMLGCNTRIPDELQLFRSDNNKFNESDLQKILIDFTRYSSRVVSVKWYFYFRNEKSGKLSIIPGSSITAKMEISSKIIEHQMQINSTSMPSSSWNMASDSSLSACFEAQSFNNFGAEPHTNFINNLYVYPLMLKYDNQKVFNKARNIACSIRFVSFEGQNEKISEVIYNRFVFPVSFVRVAHTAIHYHEQCPLFSDEIKIRLPVTLQPTDHLLFTFTHVSVGGSLSLKSANETIESAIGYAWLPLVKGDRLVIESDEQEVALPVASELPKDYISYQSLGLGKGHSGPDIRWVDGGKPLFRIRLRLISSVFTSEPNLQMFFQSCQRLQRAGVIPDAVDKIFYRAARNESLSSSAPPSIDDNEDKIEKCCQHITRKAELLRFNIGVLKIFFHALLDIEINRLIPYLPLILNRLLLLLCVSVSENMAHGCLRVRYSEVPWLKLRPILNITFAFAIWRQFFISEMSYRIISAFFFSTLVGIIDRATKTGKEIFLRSFIRNTFQPISVKTRTSPEDETTHSSVGKYLPSWIIKFSDDLDILAPILRHLWFFLDIFSKSMAQKVLDLNLHKLPRRSRFSPEFLYRSKTMVEELFSLIISKHRDIPQECRIANTSIAYFLRVLRDYKLELLRILAGHEHWLPLSLPVLLDANVNYSDEFFLSELYCRHHFLVGLLLQELRASLRESREYRRRVIEVVTKLLAKHARDKRKLIGMLYLHSIDGSNVLKAKSELRKLFQIISGSSAQGKIAILYLPLLHLAMENLNELESVSQQCDPVESSVVNAVSRIGERASSLTVDFRNSIRSDFESLFSEPARSMHQRNHSYHPSSQPISCETHIAGLAEKLDKNEKMQKNAKKIEGKLYKVINESYIERETSDILLCVLFILHNLPRKILPLLWSHFESKGLLSDFINLLEVILATFRYRGKTDFLKFANNKLYFSHAGISPGSASISRCVIMDQASVGSSSSEAQIIGSPSIHITEPGEATLYSSIQESNLIQEIALTVLDIVRDLAEYISTRLNFLMDPGIEKTISKLLSIQLSVLGDHWTEAVRLTSLSVLADFINLFRSQLFENGSINDLSALIEGLLLQLNSRFSTIQSSSTALLYLVLKNGYDCASLILARQTVANMVPTDIRNSAMKNISLIERLGPPGSQTSVALSRLLGRKVPLANSIRFENGLALLESYVTTEMKPKIFERAVQELIYQLKGILSATGALTDSYRGSAALRSAWFESLANTHIRERFYAEAAACQAHVVAIIAKELYFNGNVMATWHIVFAGIIDVDWKLFEAISETITKDEKVFDKHSAIIQQAGFCLVSFDNYTSTIEKVVRSLFFAERYEAIGPIYRLAIPVFEQQNDFESLVKVYTELQKAYSLAEQMKITGKRHLGTYFKIFFYGQNHFKEDHNTEWIYREPGLISLAEAYERMKEMYYFALGHERIQIVAEGELNKEDLKDDTAYIQLTHVEPFKDGVNRSDFDLHTNIQKFFYEMSVIDELYPEAPEVARQGLKLDLPFPNVRRRARVINRAEIVLSPLELARDKLLFKAKQIRRILDSTKFVGTTKKGISENLDIKGLQLLLQGAIQPTVNIGPLAYAEAFTTPSQIERYGDDGIKSLANAFICLMNECGKALDANEAAIGVDQVEYQNMLKNAFAAMVERLQVFFGKNVKSSSLTENIVRNSVHIFDSIGDLILNASKKQLFSQQDNSNIWAVLRMKFHNISLMFLMNRVFRLYI
ncbi:unnamed protein product [Dracunculus medinensis]|uniref:C2 DOCK-type domain-containing protein n=1 Tax=Dracunculus medinensis TaxID=318479 RepID=A0A3P7PXJ0_DRAME|nr:unnamed protein product [Dracunculus medinensis]